MARRSDRFTDEITITTSPETKVRLLDQCVPEFPPITTSVDPGGWEEPTIDRAGWSVVPVVHAEEGVTTAVTRELTPELVAELAERCRTVTP